MSNCTYLFSAETAEGTPCVFSASDACLTQAGDYVLSDGEVFEIKTVAYVDVQSDAYTLISRLADIRQADAILACRWKKGLGYNG